LADHYTNSLHDALPICLAQLREMKLKRDSLLLKLGAARQQAPRAWRLVEVEVPTNGSKLTYRLRKEALRAVRRREGHYLLRTNLDRKSTRLNSSHVKSS